MPEFDGVPWHLHSGYKKSEETLIKQNEKGWGVFFTVNELDESLDPGKHRTAKMVTRCRAVFMDDDNKRKEPRGDFPIKPSLIVSSSPGKYHYYWLTSTDDKETWRKVQNGLIELYDGDNNAKDLSRYLRLPGYNHNKSKAHEVTWEGEGQTYSWEEILDSFPAKEITAKRSKEIDEERSASKTVESYKEDILSGKDYHGSILSLSYQLVQEGVKKSYIITTIQGFMNMVEDKDERWHSRYNDIERLVDQAVKKDGDSPDADISGINVDDIDEFDTKMPWPPGLLGVLCQDAYDMQMFQYKEVAVVSALGLVAGIAGRRFNINGSGLNLYLTLIMNTGMGKDSIGKFINGALLNLNEVGSALSFCGPARFTGPKSIIRSLENARSQVCVFTEAGLLLKSKAGDNAGISRVLLSLYNKSGSNDVSGSEIFSKEEDSLKMLRAPALSIVNEATPETLLEAFKSNDSLERGELPRQSIYRIVGNKPYMNFEAAGKRLSKDSEDRLRHLIKMCSSVQAVEDPQAYHLIPEVDVRVDMAKFASRYVDIENEHRNIDSIKSIMASRCFLKALRFAGIASVYNHTDAVVRMKEWEWAKDMVEYEMSGIDNFFQGGKFGNVYADLIRRIVGVAIVKILTGKYKSRKMQVSSIDAKAGKFPLYCLAQALVNNKELATISDDTESRSAPRDGLEKVIGYMERMGYLIKDATSKTPVLKVTKAFEILMGEDL